MLYLRTSTLHEEHDMTEPTPEAVPAEAKAPKEPRATIARDEAVLAFVTEAGEAGVTRKQVLAKLHEGEPTLSASQAYLTLNRLKAAGKVTRTHVEGDHKWTAVAA
jgi:Fe2+ or Zn2+ uptake regulation protein